METTTETLLAATTALGVAVAAAACSGESKTAGEAIQRARPTSSQTANAGARAPQRSAAEYLDGEKSGRCTVTFDPSIVSTEQIAAAIEGAGYEPMLASTPPDS